jgi:glutamine synthetase
MTCWRPDSAAWPAEPPALHLIHPGYHLLADAHMDLAEAPLAIVQRTAQGLGLPLRSLEIELGPSQFEAVFAPTDALTAADQMVLFRNGVRQALRRAGYTPASSAARRCRRRWPAAGICTSRWWTRRAGRPWCGRHLPATRWMRARCCPTPGRTGWAACWRMPPAWRRCVHPAFPPTAASTAA